jgi:hypothetical protein
MAKLGLSKTMFHRKVNAGHIPKVTPPGGSDVLHRTHRSLNNRLEQDHRGLKHRYYPTRGFGSVTSASHFCRAFNEVRHFFNGSDEPLKNERDFSLLALLLVAEYDCIRIEPTMARTSHPTRNTQLTGGTSMTAQVIVLPNLKGGVTVRP